MKSTILTFRIRKALLLLLQVWIVVSAFYYIENLFSPSYYMGYEEGTLHKTVKYVICVFFTVAFCVLSRAYSLLLIIALMVVLSVLLVLYRGAIEISTLSILITATMIAYALVPSIWETDLRRIGRIAVYAGAVVGVFSITEMTVLAPLFESTWASTGSVRSVSTQLNPNNLGLYTGACLILLPFLGLRPLALSVCGVLIVFAFVASGSRTAWVAIVAVIGYQFLASAVFRSTVIRLMRRHLLRLIFPVVTFTVIFTAYQAFHSQPATIEIVNRGADLYTASIRWDNLIRFINAIDMWILLPDLTGERADFIQDNFYLVVLNSFGAVGVMMFLAFFATHFSLRKSTNPDMSPWKFVFAFYMVAGLSGSQLNSFPNNQLFFLSLGAVYVFDMRFLRGKAAKYRNPPLGVVDTPSFKS